MLEFKLTLERVEEGRVRAVLTDISTQMPDGEELFLWQLEVSQSYTKAAQKAVIKAAAAYLNSFVDLSEGGRS